MSEKAYAKITTPERPGKPRETGITMLIDWGFAPGHQEDLLQMGAEYIDLAKVAVGISGLLSKEVLGRKLDSYKAHAVRPFPGGQYLEYAVGHDLTREYLEESKAAGYDLIEVSDNTVPFSPAFKRDLIKQAKEEFGFDILGETGSKVATTEVKAMVEDIRNCLEAGAWKVFVEAADLYKGTALREELVNALKAEIPLKDIIIELPGWWLSELGTVKASTIKTLIHTFGPEVNLANVGEREIYFTETLRRKTGTAGFSEA